MDVMLLVFATLAIACAGADPKRITFTNQVETFTNIHGKAYLKVKLDYAEGDFLYFNYTDSLGRGRMKLIDLKEADVTRFGLTAQSEAATIANQRQVQAELDKEAARVKATFAALDAKAAKDKKQPFSDAVQMALDEGIFTKVRDLGDGCAEVWVGSTFYLLDFETKRKSALAVLGNLGYLDRKPLGGVTFRDNLTGKEVASLSAFGFKVK